MIDQNRREGDRRTNCSTCDIDKEEHDQHHQFMKLLIKKEEQRIALRQSIIEKTLSSLVWSFICFMFFAIWKYLTTYGGIK